jgi:hypothetical protein
MYNKLMAQISTYYTCISYKINIIIGKFMKVKLIYWFIA